MKPKPTVGKIPREWVRFLFLVLLLFVTLRALAVDAYTIPTSSMENTLLVGDFLLVNKALFGANVPGTGWVLPAFREPRRGEVIVFRPPHDPEKSYVKRVVGIEGDTLEMRGKVLFLNGKAVEEGYARHIDVRGDAIHPGMGWQSDHLVAATPDRRYAPSRDFWGPLVVAQGRYFVLGDNRDNSEDSRYWGFVGREDVRGKPWVVYLSLEDSSDGKGFFQRVRWSRFAHMIN
jgi:signal peptidase I